MKHGLFTSPEQYRRAFHEAWARGLNQALVCLYTHQPSEEKPGCLFYDIFNRHFTWWPLADGFIGYLARCQSLLLQHGDFVADAAYFVGEGACRFVPGKSFLKPALPAGYDYDGINAEVLRTRGQREGRPTGAAQRSKLPLFGALRSAMHHDECGHAEQDSAVGRARANPGRETPETHAGVSGLARRGGGTQQGRRRALGSCPGRAGRPQSGPRASGVGPYARRTLGRGRCSAGLLGPVRLMGEKLP